MLKADFALDKIERALKMGAKLFLPANGKIEETSVDQVAQIKTAKSDMIECVSMAGYRVVITNDYRLESLYAQAQSFLFANGMKP